MEILKFLRSPPQNHSADIYAKIAIQIQNFYYSKHIGTAPVQWKANCTVICPKPHRRFLFGLQQFLGNIVYGIVCCIYCIKYAEGANTLHYIMAWMVICTCIVQLGLLDKFYLSSGETAAGVNLLLGFQKQLTKCKRHFNLKYGNI